VPWCASARGQAGRVQSHVNDNHTNGRERLVAPNGRVAAVANAAGSGRRSIMASQNRVHAAQRASTAAERVRPFITESRLAQIGLMPEAGGRELDIGGLAYTC
jgi:hypothetical protein